MLIDNVLNGADPKTSAYFHNQEPRASYISQKDVTAISAHQISKIKLRHLSRKGLSSLYGLQPNAVVIYGQLFTVSLDAGHDTNVTTIAGKQADPDDQKRAYDEVGIYTLNRKDLEHAISAGAYDKPKYFEERLNAELHGIEYQLPTRIHLDILDELGSDNLSTTDSQKVQSNNKRRIIMVSDVNPVLKFNHHSPRQYNNFDFFLSQSIDDIYKDFEANDDGVGMDDLMLQQQKKADSEANQQTRHLISSLDSSNPSIQASKKASEKEKSASIASSEKNAHNLKAANPNSRLARAKATKEHISNQEHVVNNELNMMPQSSSSANIAQKASSSSSLGKRAKSSKEESEATLASENQGISRSASTVTNEMDMTHPFNSSGKAEVHHHNSHKNNLSDPTPNNTDDGPAF